MREEFYIERVVRIIAGAFIMLSLILAHSHFPNSLVRISLTTPFSILKV